jgi:hypothetical protein
MLGDANLGFIVAPSFIIEKSNMPHASLQAPSLQSIYPEIIDQVVMGWLPEAACWQRIQPAGRCESPRGKSKLPVNRGALLEDHCVWHSRRQMHRH